MKHPLKITLLLVALFVVAQLAGLFLVGQSITAVTVVNGTATLQHSETAIGARPDLQGYQSFLYLVIGVAIGTGLLLLLVRFRKVKLWKFWFFLAIFLAQLVALGVLIPSVIAAATALVLALWKIYRSNPVVHNITEILIYAGIAVLLVPIFDVTWMFVVLLTISLYDAWAVWRSKHMVVMAEFQKSSAVFAGLMIPKKHSKQKQLTPPSHPQRTKTPTTATTATAASRKVVAKTAAGKLAAAHPPAQTPTYAILGGGDIAFPLLFTGAVMEGLIRHGLGRTSALLESTIITAFAALALLLLFTYAKKDRYYPAMPFLTAGCLVGWLVTLLL